jgi:hypothetical protein
MFTLNEKSKKISIVATVVIVLIVLIGLFFGNDEDSKDVKIDKNTTSSTTTLPAANSQACEFFTKEILATGSIISNKPAVASEDLKRCTYEDINEGINYLTLFLGKPAQCDVLKNDAVDPKSISSISPDAYFFEVIDPTIIVKMKDRCFFIQGSKTLIDEVSLTNIATAIFSLFTSVDSTTTTTTIPIDPNSTTTTNVIPGQNTVVIPSTVVTTTKK